MFADSASVAQWLSAVTPLILLVIVPAIGLAVRSLIDGRLTPFREQLAKTTEGMEELRHELREHMRIEDRDATARNHEMRSASQRIDTLGQQMATMDGRLQEIQRRGRQHREED